MATYSKTARARKSRTVKRAMKAHESLPTPSLVYAAHWISRRTGLSLSLSAAIAEMAAMGGRL